MVTISYKLGKFFCKHRSFVDSVPLADLLEVIEGWICFAADRADDSIIDIHIHDFAVLEIARRLWKQELDLCLKSYANPDLFALNQNFIAQSFWRRKRLYFLDIKVIKQCRSKNLLSK